MSTQTIKTNVVSVPRGMTTPTNAVVTKTDNKDPTNEKIEKKRKEYSKIVTGIFHCFQPLGGSVSFCYKEFPNDQIKSYTFKDGEEYEIPLGVAKHLNNRCAEEVHSLLMDREGNPIVDKSKKNHRFAFKSKEFV